jgi:hypothetical protein
MLGYGKSALPQCAIMTPMFDHQLIKKHAFESIPLERDLTLMDEKWMQAYETALLGQFNGKDYQPVGYVSYAAARSISDTAIELSWYPNILTRYHEVRVLLPRSQFRHCLKSFSLQRFCSGRCQNRIMPNI